MGDYKKIYFNLLNYRMSEKIKYEPSYGYITDYYIKKYIKEKNIKINNISLYASDNIDDKLYFWQLYNIIGEDNIRELITNFYKRVFDDMINKVFRKEFVNSGALDYHIKHQTDFWLDVFGGGKYYKNLKILNLKHDMVKKIINKRGAQIWMKHILKSLEEQNFDKIDIRINDTIINFLLFFMKGYLLRYSKL